MFRSPRQAIAYMAAFERGPSLASPDLHRVARSSKMGSWDAFRTSLTISRFLYGPKDAGGLGIDRGGAIDRAIREWAQSGSNGPEHYTPVVARVVGKLVGYLKDRGMKVDPPIIERRRKPEGAVEYVLVEYVDTETQKVVRKEWEKVA